MCGRYRRKSDKQRIADVCRNSTLAPRTTSHLVPYSPSSPSSRRANASSNSCAGDSSWPNRLLFNARSEGIESSKFWKDAFLKDRVIVPADAIFEWKAMPKGQKKPKYEFTVAGQEPFGMAGLWKLWKNPKTDQWERTFAVITGEPNELMAPILDRMTTFLELRDYAEYLASRERLPVHLLHILPAEEMRAILAENPNITNQQVSLFDSQ